MEIDLKAHCREGFVGACTRYLADLEALPDDQITKNSGGVSRSPIEFTYEVVTVNQRVTNRLRGEDPGPFDPELFKNIPESFKSPSECRAEFAKSRDELLSALDAIPAGEVTKEIVTPGGPTSAFNLVSFVAIHIAYHDGQLNLLQAQAGDSEIHWQG